MNSALRHEVEDADLRRELSKAFAKVADHMRNKQECP
jgi:truncated hemoglobin YjbI